MALRAAQAFRPNLTLTLTLTQTVIQIGHSGIGGRGSGERKADAPPTRDCGECCQRERGEHPALAPTPTPAPVPARAPTPSPAPSPAPAPAPTSYTLVVMLPSYWYYW